MLLGFLYKYKHTRHIQRRTPFNLLLVLKFQSTRTTQGIFYLIIFNVLISYHIKEFFAIVFFNFHKYFVRRYVSQITYIFLFLIIVFPHFQFLQILQFHCIFCIAHLLNCMIVLLHYKISLFFSHLKKFYFFHRIV